MKIEQALPKYLIHGNLIYPDDKVGMKAQNLHKYHLNSPEFYVIDYNFYIEWKKYGKSTFRKKKSIIQFLCIHFQRSQFSEIIIRSSSSNELILDRGKYLSLKCSPVMKQVQDTIIKIYKDFFEKDKNNNIALIFQSFVLSKIQGHLSNERRLTKNGFRWIIEKEISFDNSIITEEIVIKPEELPDHFNVSISSCLNSNTLNKSLRFLASWLSRDADHMYHVEWIWDGAFFWILQVDNEEPATNGTKPGSEWQKRASKQKITLDQHYHLEVLEFASTTTQVWPKIECIKTFQACNLPSWNIYVLENKKVLESVIRDEIEPSLEMDLKWFINKPVLIRTDVITGKDVLLPRTETIFTYKDAKEFISKTSKDLINQGLKIGEFCYLIHEFITSRAGALAYTKPHFDRTRIDSTWGIVEGLYFHPHDSFEVFNDGEKIVKKIRCKQNYIDVNETGDWISKSAGKNYDWKQSITAKQIEEIRIFTQRISNHLNKSVTVMFFVNENKNIPEVLPWYYSADEVFELGTAFVDPIFAHYSKVIKSKQDYEDLKTEAKHIARKKKQIKVNLNTDIIRDRDFMKEIGYFALRNGFLIIIEGSVLSHPYYFLKSIGADVRCVDPLESVDQTKEFYKLVRDKIPIKIKRNDETVVTTNVTPNELIYLLKEKAVEEAYEFYWSKQNDNMIEELADILEVIKGSCKAFGINFNEIETISDRKKEARGGFDEGVYLVATKENSLFQVKSNKKALFPEDDQSINVKLKPIVKFFIKGNIRNFKSLTKVSKIFLPYINNYSHKSNSFRYLIKNKEFNSIYIEYTKKGIIIHLESQGFKDDKELKGLFKTSPKVDKD